MNGDYLFSKGIVFLMITSIFFEILAQEKNRGSDDLANYDNYQGEWQNSIYEEVIFTLDIYNETIFGKRDFKYVYKNGASKRTEFFFRFDKKVSKNEFSGKLETFDGYYGCFLNNGKATIKFVDQNEFQITFNLVTFEVPNHEEKNEEPLCVPKYCYSYYYNYYFICGYNCKKRCKKRESECKVTHRILIMERYVRKK